MDPDLAELTRRLREFAAERDWARFHSPKNLASALAVEVAELLEPFQWLTEAQSRALDAGRLAHVRDEIADVLLYLLMLADALGVDPTAAAADKLRRNAGRFPVGQARSSTVNAASAPGPAPDPGSGP